ncbi:FkbM family methyltransferase [Saccharopolyspora erythraea]|uniref:FkbM family methyltransferase n=1 Tax=Saccharopolyspora erythraea TaxID=1836 RepID=UPI001BA4A60C|nr:FkbM family methyltransferase [Saccharopolyspora erythraea]QUH03617.1 FkbM family methyltransferase [Saccharopolyspora erythraea]
MLAAWEDLNQDGTYAKAVRGLRPGSHIADVGSRHGLSAIFFADHLPDARILAFEPVPPAFECLRENLVRYVPNGQPFHCALGEEPGSRELTYSVAEAPGTHKGGNVRQAHELRRREAVERTCSVRVTTLTRVAERQQVESIDLLRISTRHAGPEVLRGIGDDLWTRIRRIVVELHDEDGLSELEGLLRARQYEVMVPQGTKGRMLLAMRG